MARFLIADDNEDSRTILRKILERNGNIVDEAPNGAEALKLAKKSLPDIIISDILMPEMDGFMFCMEVKKDRHLNRIPFVFYTATYIEPRDERLAMSLGASRFIVKPVELNEFMKTIENVLSEYKEKTLSVPEKPLVNDIDLSRMLHESITGKMDEKVEELRIYKEIFLNSNDATAIINPEGFYVRQNTSHRVLTGFPDNELIGKTPEIHLGKDVFSNILEKLSQKGVYRGELISHSKEGRADYIELSAFPVANNKGKVMFYIETIRDITQRKTMENELKAKMDDLEKFYNLAVGRELRMKKLKKLISKMESAVLK